MTTISCYNAVVPLCIVQGDTKIINITFVDENDAPVDTTGWDIRSQIRYGDADNNAVLVEFVPSWNANVATLTLTAAESDTIPMSTVPYAWDAKIDDGTSVVTVASGPVDVQGTITREDVVIL